MPYAVPDDVLSRAGRLGGAFSVAGKRPNANDITAYIDQVSTEIDEAVRAVGFDPTGLDANAKKGFLDLAAYGALARALRALGDRSPEVLQILVEADMVWMSAMGDPASRQKESVEGSIRGGRHPVIRALVAAAGGGGSVVSAGSFWVDESNYGRPEKAVQEYLNLWGTNLAPGFSRGQKF